MRAAPRRLCCRCQLYRQRSVPGGACSCKSYRSAATLSQVSAAAAPRLATPPASAQIILDMRQLLDSRAATLAGATCQRYGPEHYSSPNAPSSTSRGSTACASYSAAANPRRQYISENYFKAETKTTLIRGTMPRLAPVRDLRNPKEAHIIQNAKTARRKVLQKTAVKLYFIITCRTCHWLSNKKTRAK